MTIEAASKAEAELIAARLPTEVVAHSWRGLGVIRLGRINREEIEELLAAVARSFHEHDLRWARVRYDDDERVFRANGQRSAPDSRDEPSTTGDPRPPALAGLRARRDEILAMARRHGAKNVRVFGSVARGEPEAGDVDFLVDLDAGRGLLDVARLRGELEDLLGCDVDVVERVDPHRREHVEAEAVAL